MSLDISAIKRVERISDAVDFAATTFCQVKYWGELSWDAIHQNVGHLVKPEVILWYAGAYGLKENATAYYRHHIAKMMEATNNCRVNLFDLAAWGAFRNVSSIESRNKSAIQINQWGLSRLRCIHSADIFKNFLIEEPGTRAFITDTVLRRDFIFKSSLGFKENHLTIGDVFKRNCPILEPLYDLDTAKAYSPIQYLEGLFLIESLVKERLSEQSDINIVFVLPNDEPKYYRDDSGSFESDVQTFLMERCRDAIAGFKYKIHIHFMNFSFGNGTSDRPYNDGTKTVQKVSLPLITNQQIGNIMAMSVETTAPINLRSLATRVPGFGDYKPEQQILLDLWKRTLKDCYQLNGFNPLDVPPFVRKEFLKAKGGINNEMFAVSSLWNDAPTPYGLAFDRTVPFALWVRDHEREIPFPFKRYDINLSFRGENPAPGRFQGFYQCDIDIVGRKLGLDNDVQCISALVEGLTRLLDTGIDDPANRGYKMYLNHITIPKGLFAQAKVPAEKVQDALHIVDKMDKIGPGKVADELKLLLQGNVEEQTIMSLVEILAYKGSLAKFTIPANFPKEATGGLEALTEIINNLAANGISLESLQFCPGMVRGLNYYTGVVFETFLDALPKAGSVMSGGRYDELVDTFTQDKNGETKNTGIEGVGGSIGLTRLFDVLSAGKNPLINPKIKTACKVMVLAKDKLPIIPWKIAKALRDANISCDVYTGNKDSLGDQLVYANKSGVPVAVMVITDDKTKEMVFCVKDLKSAVEKQDKDLTEIDRVVESVKRFLNQ